MLKACGVLKYGENYKLYVDIDLDFSRYYLKLLKGIDVKPQRYSTHISVIRNEVPINLQYWNKYDNKTIWFLYDPDVKTNDVYFWMDVYSPELNSIRKELGLKETSEFSRPPSGEECFHITIGNLK